MALKRSICGVPINGIGHICAFFDSRDEQYGVLNPYFREGIDNGEEVINVMERYLHADHLQRMIDGGIDVDSAVAFRQFKLIASDEFYMGDEMFVADRMCEILQDAVDSSIASRRPIRTYGDMDWALRCLPSTDELMAYEAKVNLIAEGHNCTFLCSYDINRFSGRVITDVLATHSHVVMAGRVHVNPFYTEPMEFLKKLASRRRTSPTARPLS